MQSTAQYAFTFLLMFAIGLGVPISPLLASKMGANWVEIGSMGITWGSVFALSAFLTGRLSDRIGRKPVLALSAALSALAALLFLRAASVLDLIGIRGLEGLAWACFWPPMEALATETSGAERLGRGIGLVTTVYSLAFATGSFMGGYITSIVGFPVVFASYLGISSLAIPMALLIEAPRLAQAPKATLRATRVKRLFSRNSAMGYFLGAAYTFGFANVWVLLSVYAAGIGIAVFWIGFTFSIFWLGRILGAAGAAGASDRFGRKHTAILALGGGFVGFILIGLAREPLFLAAGALLAGLSIGAVFPVNVAIIADDIEPNIRGSAMGVYEMACATSFMVASAVGGITAETVNPRAPYAVSALVYASSAAALAVFLPRRRQ